MFENRAQRKISGRCSSNEELYNLYASPNIVRVIKLRRVRWTEHVARMEEMRNIYKMLVGKPESSMSLRNVGILPQHHTASQPRRPRLESSQPWRRQISQCNNLFSYRYFVLCNEIINSYKLITMQHIDPGLCMLDLTDAISEFRTLPCLELLMYEHMYGSYIPSPNVSLATAIKPIDRYIWILHDRHIVLLHSTNSRRNISCTFFEDISSHKVSHVRHICSYEIQYLRGEVSWHDVHTKFHDSLYRLKSR
jgi:hypothetical protein